MGDQRVRLHLRFFPRHLRLEAHTTVNLYIFIQKAKRVCKHSNESLFSEVAEQKYTNS